jgi:hypothetical protein
VAGRELRIVFHPAVLAAFRASKLGSHGLTRLTLRRCPRGSKGG